MNALFFAYRSVVSQTVIFDKSSKILTLEVTVVLRFRDVVATQPRAAPKAVMGVEAVDWWLPETSSRSTDIVSRFYILEHRDF